MNDAPEQHEGPWLDRDAGSRPGGRYLTPSELAEREARSERTLKMILRLVFMVLLVTVTLLTIASTTEDPTQFEVGEFIGLFLAALAIGVIVLLADILTPKKRLASFIGVYVGVCLALVGALAVSELLDVVAQSWDLSDGPPHVYVQLTKAVVGIILAYLAVSFVLTTKDDFRLVIPYVEFSKQVRGVRPMLLDTSALIDGRIEGLVQTGFVDAPLVVPRFVLEELQALSDSGDRLKRARGRRGLDLVGRLQSNPAVDTTLDNTEVQGRSVDRMLVELARDEQMRILTTDYNLEKVAKIHGVTVLNLNDLASSLRPTVVPGESLRVEIVKPGENEGQGVGYLPDGTMVVVEDAASRLGQAVDLVVSNSLQTSAGRMIFGRLAGSNGEAEPAARRGPDESDTPEPAGAEEASVRDAAAKVARSATHQPRATDRPTGRRGGTPRRNPRRAE